jgi:hypothetical protein
VAPEQQPVGQSDGSQKFTQAPFWQTVPLAQSWHGWPSTPQAELLFPGWQPSSRQQPEQYFEA